MSYAAKRNTSPRQKGRSQTTAESAGDDGNLQQPSPRGQRGRNATTAGGGIQSRQERLQARKHQLERKDTDDAGNWLGFNDSKNKQLAQGLLDQDQKQEMLDDEERIKKDKRDIAQLDHLAFKVDVENQIYDDLNNVATQVKDYAQEINKELNVQQEGVEQLTKNMEDANVNMDKAQEELQMATKYQQKGMKNKAGIACILLVFLILLLGSFMTSGPQEKPDWMDEEQANNNVAPVQESDTNVDAATTSNGNDDDQSTGTTDNVVEEDEPEESEDEEEEEEEDEDSTSQDEADSSENEQSGATTTQEDDNGNDQASEE